MKKHLIALAVAGAVAAPVMAQNVTVYGVLGGGYVSTETTSTTATNADNDQLSSTVWGLQGSEDLGGGMKASFQLEKDFQLGSGADSNIDLWNLSVVRIAGSFGTVSFGRQGTAYDSHKSFGNVGANFFSSTDQYLDDMGDKFDGTVRFDTPTYAGFAASFSNTQIAGDEDIVSYAVTYSAGKLGVALSGAQDNVDQKETTLNISYALLPTTTAYLQMMKGEQPANAAIGAGGTATTARAGQKVTKLSVKHTMGAIDLLGSIQRYREDDATKKENAAGLMAVYNLSKRTAVFAGYNNRDVAGVDTTVTAVGVQHKF
jgi:predicted porin